MAPTAGASKAAAARPPAVAGAILVGGRARRLGGRVKPALPVGTQTILERQLDALRGAGISERFLVGRSGPLAVTGVRQFPDLVAAGGALAGLYSALLLATGPVVVVLAGDMPFVSAALLRRLADLEPGDDAIVPRTADGWHPLCAAYRRSVAARLKARLDRGRLRVSDALADLKVRQLTVDELDRLDGTRMLLMNVNTSDDYDQAERRAGARS